MKYESRLTEVSSARSFSDAAKQNAHMVISVRGGFHL